jgi:hypothetical protein
VHGGPQLRKHFTNYHTWRPTTHKRWIEQALWLETQSSLPQHRHIEDLLCALQRLPLIDDFATAMATAARLPFLMQRGATAQNVAEVLSLVALALTSHPLVRGIVYSRAEALDLITALCDATAASSSTYSSSEIIQKAAKAQALLGCHCAGFWERATRPPAGPPEVPVQAASLLISACFIQAERNVAVLTPALRNAMFLTAARGAADFDAVFLSKFCYAATCLFTDSPPAEIRADLINAVTNAALSMSIHRIEKVLHSATCRRWLAAPGLVSALKTRAEQFRRMPPDVAASIHRYLQTLGSGPSHSVRRALLASFELTTAAAHAKPAHISEVLWVLRATLLQASGSTEAKLSVLHAQAEAVLITVGIYLQDAGLGGDVDIVRELVHISWLWPEALEKLPLGAAEAAAAPVLASGRGDDVALALEILARSRRARTDPADGPALCAAATRAGTMSPRGVVCTVWALQALGVTVDPKTRCGLEEQLRVVRAQLQDWQYREVQAVLAGSMGDMGWPPPASVPGGATVDLRWPEGWQSSADIE